MRILHTSDWHLGKKLNDFDRFGEQEAVMNEICTIADNENVDVVVIAGDLFDTYNPSSNAQRLLYQTLYNISNSGNRPVIAIAGNHDSPDRIESPDMLANVSGIFLYGYPGINSNTTFTHGKFTVIEENKGFLEIKLPKYDYNIRIIITPFANQERLKSFLGEDECKEQEALRQKLQNIWQAAADKFCDENGVNILVAHQFVINNENDTQIQEPEDENAINVGGTSAIYSANIPSQIQYTALGHIHRCSQIGNKNIMYSGSPLEYSFSESEQDKYVIICDIEPGTKPLTRKIPLTSGCKLVRNKFDNIIDAVQWLTENDNVWVELTIVSDNYLSSVDNKMLHNASDKIVTIKPLVRLDINNETKSESISNKMHDKDALFKAFFKNAKGQDPNDKLIELFHEILSKKS